MIAKTYYGGKILGHGSFLSTVRMAKKYFKNGTNDFKNGMHDYIIIYAEFAQPVITCYKSDKKTVELERWQ